jgi:hypothetical protein
MSSHRRTVLLAMAALLLVTGPAGARQNVVLNGSMEFGPGASGVDPQIAAEWAEFGVNVERSPTVNLAPPDGGWALKAFGEPLGTTAGASQLVNGITEGQEVTASVWLYTPSFDQLGGSGNAGVVLEFLDFFGGTISLHEDYPLNSSGPANTWLLASIGPLTAPAETQKIRVSCKLFWSPQDIFGAAYWDDAQVSVDSGPNVLLNGDFEQAGNSPGQSTQGLDDWSGFNDQEKSDDFALDQEHSLKLGVRELYNGLWQNMTTLVPNEEIRLRAWVLNSPDDPLLESSQAGIKLEFDPTAEVPPPEENLAFTINDPVDEWTQVVLETTVPAEVTIARIVVICNPDPNETGAVYFDDVHAGVTSAPGDNLLSNASFETGTGIPNGWAGFGDAHKSCFDVFRTGICSVLIDGSEVGGVFQDVDVTPGQNLYLSAWVQTPNFAAIDGPLTTAGIKVEWAIGGVPQDIDIGQQDNVIDDTAPTGVWIPLSIDYTMGADEAALARFTNLSAKGVSQTGSAYFDACEAVVINRYDGSDVDGDDDEDLRDFAWLQRSFNGSGANDLLFNGLTFDHDDDIDVDLQDVSYFQTWMTGPAQ